MKLSFKNKPTAGNQPNRRSAESSQPRTSRVSSTQGIEQRYAFRRNRTITGSTSSDIKSGNELNATVRSPRAQAHHLSSLRRRVIIYLGLVLLVVFLLYLLLSQLIAATVIKVEGTVALSAQDSSGYQQSLDEYFAARPLERLRFSLDNPKLLSHMQASHPDIESLTISSLDQLGEALVVIKPRQAIARWNVAGKRQYVDAKGVVFERNYAKDPTLQIVDDSGIDNKGSASIASRRFLGFVGLAVGLADNDGLKVTKITIPSLTTRQIELKLKGVKPYFKLSVDRSVGEQMEDVTRLQHHLAQKGLKPEYVDVRVKGKAYYR